MKAVSKIYFTVVGGRTYTIKIKILNVETGMAEVLVKSNTFTCRDKYVINPKELKNLSKNVMSAFASVICQVATLDVANRVKRLICVPESVEKCS